MSDFTTSAPPFHDPERFVPRQRLHRSVPWPLSTLVMWQDRARMRAHLATLPAHLLRDTGLSAEDARSEAAKPFWQA